MNSTTTESPRLTGPDEVLGPKKHRRARLLSRIQGGLIRRLLKYLGDPPVSVALSDGTEIAPAVGTPLVRVLIHDRATLWKLARDPLFQFGEAYAAGRLEVEGDLAQLLTIVFRAMGDGQGKSSGWPAWPGILRRRRSNTLSKSQENISHHYDIGNDFYQLWLDEQLLYTCAYFKDRSMSLERAQIAKMEHVCRKLRLRPGQRVIEAGCGWGALARFMARRYGVTVRAFNISGEQVAYAQREAEREGLAGRVEFITDDWRNIRQPCDVFVSIGMLEHVGPENYGQLGDVIHRSLTADGCGLIHTIGQNQPGPLNPWIERRIFPGARPPTLAEMTRIFAPHNLAILNVENLRPHYALTLRHWLDRFEQAADEVRVMFDDKFVSMWRLYLSGSIAAFETGALQLFQVLFSRAANDCLPWTRDDVYRSVQPENRDASKSFLASDPPSDSGQ